MKQTKEQMVAAALAVAEELAKSDTIKKLIAESDTQAIFEYYSAINFRDKVYKAYDEMIKEMQTIEGVIGSKEEVEKIA